MKFAAFRRPFENIPLIAVLSVVAMAAAQGMARAQSIPQSVPPDWQATLRSQVEKSLDATEAGLKKDKPTVTIRNLPNGALAALYLKRDPAQVETLLRALFAAQEMDPASPRYGSVMWQMNHPEINDLNSDEFSTQALGPLLIEFGNQLSPDLRRDLEAHIKAFFVALKRRDMKTPAYTNIFVMRAVETALMGEAIHDDTMADQGYQWLDEWLAYTATAGIREFDSPTYTAVDLNSLYLGWRYARRPGAKEKFQKALDLFWSDAAANYFAGRGSLSGPHSRDYDFVGGWSGGMGYYYEMAGWHDDGTSGMLDMERVYPLLNASPGNYEPSSEIKVLTALPERIVRSRWDSVPGRDRYNYVTPDFAIGGASGDYGPQDKFVTVEFASAKKLPVICVTADTVDSPYGTVKTLDRTGHAKAVHLPPGLTCVQDKGTLLALFDIDISKAGDARQVATSVLFPIKADRVTFDGEPVEISGPVDKPARFGGVLGVREGNSGVAIRVFAVGDENGELTTPLAIRAEPEGLKPGAARIVIHTPRTGRKGERLAVGVLVVAGRCVDDASYAALLKRVAEMPVSQKRDGGSWAVAVPDAGGHTLAATRDLEHRKIVSRTIDGKDLPPFTPLEVNGKDLAGTILGSGK